MAENEAGVPRGVPRAAEWELPQLARSRAQIYGILSTIYGGLSGEQLVRLFSSWSVSEQVFRESLPLKMKRGLKQINTWLEKRGSEPSEIAALETEFTRLIRGLGRTKSPPPPYESVYLDSGLLYGPSTQRVADTYRRFRVKGQDNEPPDYIALDMDFMRFLCDREVAAWETGNAQELLKEEEAFLHEHLASWVPAFCENVRRFDTAGFYAGLADLTEGWISCDHQIIRSILKLPERCKSNSPPECKVKQTESYSHAIE